MLEITYPTQGQVVSDSVVRFRGMTEPGADVVSGRWKAEVDADGSWSLLLVLEPGPNGAVFTATDAAGNETEARRSVTLYEVPLVSARPVSPPDGGYGRVQDSLASTFGNPYYEYRWEPSPHAVEEWITVRPVDNPGREIRTLGGCGPNREPGCSQIRTSHGTNEWWVESRYADGRTTTSPVFTFTFDHFLHATTCFDVLDAVTGLDVRPVTVSWTDGWGDEMSHEFVDPRFEISVGGYFSRNAFPSPSMNLTVTADGYEPFAASTPVAMDFWTHCPVTYGPVMLQPTPTTVHLVDILGTVMDASTGAGIGGAWVTVDAPGDPWTPQNNRFATDPNGQWHAGPGDLQSESVEATFTVTANGYETQQRVVTLAGLPCTPADSRQGLCNWLTKTINFTLAPANTP